MTQSVSASLARFDMERQGAAVYHAGLASGEKCYRGELMLQSGSYLFEATGSKSNAYMAVGWVTDYNDSEGVAASSNGDNSTRLVIKDGSAWMRNGNPENSGYEISAADIGKLCYVVDGQHVALSGSASGGTHECVAGTVDAFDSSNSPFSVLVRIDAHSVGAAGKRSA